jgi:hypothetical protein
LPHRAEGGDTTVFDSLGVAGLSIESFGSEHEKLSGSCMGTPTIPRLAQHVVASVYDVRRARGE